MFYSHIANYIDKVCFLVLTQGNKLIGLEKLEKTWLKWKNIKQNQSNYVSCYSLIQLPFYLLVHLGQLLDPT